MYVVDRVRGVSGMILGASVALSHNRSWLLQFSGRRGTTAVIRSPTAFTMLQTRSTFVPPLESLDTLPHSGSRMFEDNEADIYIDAIQLRPYFGMKSQTFDLSPQW